MAIASGVYLPAYFSQVLMAVTILLAIKLRLYVFLASGSYDMSQPASYAIIAWASWVINLAAVEISLKWRREM